ncbi:hypothetical protein AMATHDRAFT_6372 [Amanita thiersii Skay4041]|uniref:Uncharacterized protein n=1 Tax=Amanita thiersii Skay4041 TaxID=703135 RepID=A0A2A9NJF3_9AGAR|nr:hypothetical protein AMATHDRAFT_6372 [Amanita thiersii Skay4041]
MYYTVPPVIDPRPSQLPHVMRMIRTSILASYLFTISLNIYTTAAILYRIWHIAKYSLAPSSRRTLHFAMHVIVESVLLYTVSSIVAMIMWLLSLRFPTSSVQLAVAIFSVINYCMIGIAFNLLLIRVAQQRANPLDMSMLASTVPHAETTIFGKSSSVSPNPPLLPNTIFMSIVEPQQRAQVSLHNPFRVQGLSPNPTGTSTASGPPPSFHTDLSPGETRLDLNATAARVPSPPPRTPSPPPRTPTPTRTPQQEPIVPSPTITHTSQSIQERERDLASIIDEEPPAYTPSADVRHGEATLEYGPTRPFQQRPPVQPSAPQNPYPQNSQNPQNNYLRPSFTGYSDSWASHRREGSLWRQLSQITDSLAGQLDRALASSTSSNRYGNNLTPQPTGASSWSANHPGYLPPQQPPPRVWAPPPGPPPPGPSLPPRPPQGSSNNVPNNQPPPLPPRRPSDTGTIDLSVSAVRPASVATSEPTSEFARDFYAAGTGEGLLGEVEGGPAGDGTRSEGSHSPTRGRAIASLGSDPPASPSASTSHGSGIEDDDRPTTKPVPGHPLLRNGNILVYPKGHTCSKCFNVGYKSADPSHPCKKCWGKYAKAYSPAMHYAPPADRNKGATTLQRPLPRYHPPQSRLAEYQGGPSVYRSSTVRSPSSPSSSHCSWKNNDSRSPVAPQPNYPLPPQGASPAQHQQYAPPSAQPVTQVQIGPSPWSGPPPGVIVYTAGDPRLGGSLCWRCNGRGQVSYFLLDSSTCDVCDGVGRLYR